jgi:hypothetical protein
MDMFFHSPSLTQNPAPDVFSPSVSSFLPCKHFTVRLQLAGGSSWPKVVPTPVPTVSEPTIPTNGYLT